MIAVTGATGWVGGRVARALASQGQALRLVVRDSARAPDLGAEVAEAQYRDGAAMRAAFEGAETVYLVSASESADRVAEGAEVVLTGTTIDPRLRATGAPLRLEARPNGAAEFAPVREVDPAGPDGRVVATVSPGRTTAYRWFMPATGYADATWSPAVEVRVTPQGD